MKKNIKYFFNYILLFITNFCLLSSTLISSSMSKPSTIDNFKTYIFKEINITKNDVFFNLEKKGFDIQGYIDDSVIETLSNKFYSYALASLFSENEYLLVFENESVKRTYNISLLASCEAIYDSPENIVQGYLPCEYSETINFKGYNTKYGYLSSDDAIYLPESLANIIKNDFEIDKNENLIFLEGVGYSCNFKTYILNTNQSLSINCKIRGIYKNSNTQLSKNINDLVEENNYVGLCSKNIFTSLKNVGEVKLLCQFKNTNSVGNVHYQTVFQILENISLNTDLAFSFDGNINKNNDLQLNYYNYLNTSYYKNNKLFFAITLSLIILLLFLITFASTKNIHYDGILLFICVVVSFIITLLFVKAIMQNLRIDYLPSLLSIGGLQITSIVLFLEIVFAELLLRNKNRKNSMYVEISI